MDLLNIFLIAISVCAFVYAIQLFYLDRIRLRGGTIAETTSRKRAHLLRAIPVVCSILGALALVLVPIFGKPVFEACSREHQEINPDVGGIGVLLGLFLPCLVLFGVLILGHFTVHTSGAKELCMAQCANLSYLAVNLFKGRSKLNNQELVIALSSIDAVSASISMAFSDKDVLAARKLVSSGFAMQILAYVVQGIAFGEYTRRHQFQCGSSTRDQLSSPHYSTPYWICFSLRIVASILPCHVAIRLTSSLNKIENKHKSARSVRVKATALWRSLPATVATSYLIYWPFVLLHGLLIINVLRGTDTIGESWDSLVGEWGQSANAIIAVFAILHVLYAISTIFVAESTDEDGRVSGVSGRSVSLAYPQLGWRKWHRRVFTWIKQSWPFRRGLDYSDHLLVDDSILQEILEPPLQQTPEVRMQLHKELMLGFTHNEPDTILDCLDRGAPVDKPNDDGDYPIHLAARYNSTDILKGTRFTYIKDSVTHDSLLLKDSASQTPLEIACSTGTLKAVRWIMESLPRTNRGTQDTVCRAFILAILEEKLGVLDILQHLWPDWSKLVMPSRLYDYKCSLLRFAIDERKAEPTYRLTDPEVLKLREPRAREIFELCWKVDLKNYWTQIMVNGIQIETVDPEELIDNIMGSSTIDNTEALELLFALEIDVGLILGKSVACSLVSVRTPSERDSMWELVLQAGYTIELQDLDSIIVCEELWQVPFIIQSEADLRERLLKSQIMEALIHRGGRDWSEVLTASRDASIEHLQELIVSEKDQTMLQRMLNVEAMHGLSLLAYTIHTQNWDEWAIEIGLKTQNLDEDGSRRLEFMRVLLEHGSRVYESELMYAHTFNSFKFTKDIMAFMLLAVYASPEEASSALRTECNNEKPSATILTFVQVLLRCGANPTLIDENGLTPRDALSRMTDIALKERAERPRFVQMYDGKLHLSTTVFHELVKTIALLQCWEDYHKDPHTGKPTERPDEYWKAIRRNLDDTTTWAWLDEKNPEGFKIVEGN